MTAEVCGAVRTDDTAGALPCLLESGSGDLHEDDRGGEWLTTEIRRPALPYTSRPKAGRGIGVDRVNRTVVVAGQPYAPAAALELSAAIARAATETTGVAHA